MRFFLISDNSDAMNGLRLAGIEGTVARSEADLRNALEMAAQQPDIANPEAWLKQPDNISKLARLSGVPEADVPGLVKGNTYLTAAEQAQALNGPVNQAIVDTARFLKEQGKVPAAGTDYRQYVTDRFVK